MAKAISATEERLCGNCCNWRMTESFFVDGTKEWGRCTLLTVTEDHTLAFSDIGTQGTLGTPSRFGCERFTSRPSGPFTAIHSPRAERGAFLRFHDTDLDTGSLTMSQAAWLADILNGLWFPGV